MIDPTDQYKQFQLSLKVIRGQLATVAEVELHEGSPLNPGFYDDSKGRAVGEARLHFGDNYSLEIGDDYAIGRALRDLGEMLIRKANFRVDVQPGERLSPEIMANAYEEIYGR